MKEMEMANEFGNPLQANFLPIVNVHYNNSFFRNNRVKLYKRDF